MERNPTTDDEPDTSDDRLDDLDTDETAESVTGGGIVQGDGG